jgi:hypothetical protein
MGKVEVFWQLEGRSDLELLGALSALVGAGRQLLAEVVAHLAEVEERRLHLDAGYGSMFAYCVARLGMSEDEACRRIEVARLARRYPLLFPLLANGKVSLSVAALLKPHLSSDNCDTLLALVAGQSVQRARERLAAHFPKPDVASSIRKLPERNGGATDSRPVAPAVSLPPAPATRSAELAWASSRNVVTAAEENTVDPLHADRRELTATPVASATASAATSPAPEPLRLTLQTPRSRAMEPLSPGRYRVQFSADTELKNKLELARDLLRHTLPNGDLAPIIARALDLLIEQLMKRRVGAPTQRRAERPKVSHSPTSPSGKDARENEHTPASSVPPPRAPAPSDSGSAPSAFDSTTPDPPGAAIDQATRRAVLERDGLGCTWRGPDGVRCNAKAWLEYDHIQPRGKGGDSSPNNVRLLCRAHNRRAAEQTYGRSHIERAIATRTARNEKLRASPQDIPFTQA